MKKIKKFLVLTVAIISLISLSGCGKENAKSVLKKFEKNVSKTNGYQVEAEMKLINNEDVYRYDVTASYKKSDYFRVSLRNKTNNHEQIILKNDEGVYVLSPNLNKSFKFQSKWPYNNSQSYLINSVLNDMKNDTKLTMKKDGKNYVFKSTVNYKNNSNLSYQMVTLDKNCIIKSVVVYDKNDNEQIRVDYKSVDMRAKFNDDYFDVEENIKTSDTTKTEKKTSSFDEAIYPMYLPEGTYLETEKTVELDGGERIILTFAGEQSFMLVEEKVNKLDELEVVPTSGDIDLLTDSIGIIGSSSVSWISNDIEYYLVSSDLSVSELVTVAKSVATMPVGK